MTKQYWIGGFYIDLSRNQITQNNQSQTIPPKALAVLTYLAENQGQVVSQEALLSKVWQGTVVSPNTLQRSIAQLRKALGDDGKVQIYIKTHAKQGYSLECDVRWQDTPRSIILNSSEDAASQNSESINTHKNSKSNLKPVSVFAALVGIIILSIIGYQNLAPKQSSQLSFDALRLITATDDKEYDATYTPDGQYIVFHRYLDNQCGNRIWAKNIDTQKETLLTKEWGTYGRHSFSKDGKSLIFFKSQDCSQPASQKICYDLLNLDFAKALESPQDPSLILQCQNSYVKDPTWLNNNDIALLQKYSDRWKLIRYSISDNESKDLYDLKDGNLIDFAYSVKDDLIAVISIHNDGLDYIDMLKPDGRIVSSHKIERIADIPKFRDIFPSFDPNNKQLIFSTGKQLFTLSYEGKVSKISLPFAERMDQPEFHPNGKSLLMIKGPYDSDIVLLPLKQLSDTKSLVDTETVQAKLAQTYNSLERTNLGEDHALFQPNGDLIAFWSNRSGEEQIWLTDGNTPRQLTHFPIDTYINGFDWAEDGKSLLVNANSQLNQVFLDSSQKLFALEYPAARLFQWDSKNNTALLGIRIEGLYKYAEYDLKNSSLEEITSEQILWPLKSEDGRLIYKDRLDNFWQPGPVEAELIKPLEQLKSKTKSFVIKDNVIYAINTDNELWSYNLTNETFEILGKVDEDVDQLTDINETHLLMTLKVAAKKEVVELTLKE